MTVLRAAVLDRDGTLIVEREYLSDPKQVELLPGAARGLRGLRDLGLRLVVITNQSAVGRGFFDLTRLEQIHCRLRELLEAEHVELAGIYFCPHTPADACSCRKPQPGLLRQAARDFGFDPQGCFVIGDKPCDIDLGRAVGATTFLVRTGYGAQVAAAGTNADYVVDDVWGAAQVIEGLLALPGRQTSCPSTDP